MQATLVLEWIATTIMCSVARSPLPFSSAVIMKVVANSRGTVFPRKAIKFAHHMLRCRTITGLGSHSMLSCRREMK